jgi:hypothetical protein
MSDHRQLVERLAAIDATPRASWVAELRADLDAAWATADTRHLDSGRTTPVTLRDPEPPHSQPPDRRRWSILLAAAVVVLVVAAVVFVRRDSPGTIIVTTPTPTPTDDPVIDVTAPPTTTRVTNEVVPADAWPFSIIATRSVSRDLEILEITAGGSERLVRTLSPDDVGSRAAFSSGVQAVSSAGWFVAWLGNLGGVVFVDLRDPTSSPRLVACRCISGRWNPAGDRYAVVNEKGTVIIDPSTGDMVPVPGYTPVDGTPEPVWTADGTALLSTSQSSRSGLGDWSLIPIGGGQAQPGTAPLYWQRGTRFIDDRGRWIHDPYTGAFTGRVTVESDESGPEVWYDGELQPAQLRDFSFTNRGDAIWMLLATTDRSGLVLARSSAPGTHEVVIPSAPFEAVSRADFATITAVAPDDSIVVAAVVNGSGWDEILLETESGAAITLPAGTYVSGFVRATLADTLLVAEP